MYPIMKKILFRMDPEVAHEWTIRSLQLLQQMPFLAKSIQQKWEVRHPSLSSQVAQHSFPNPVGLAAGFDKHANVYPALAHLGFGFVEVGTLTPRPQSGNARPRLFRLPEDQAIINRMGFNNHGVEDAVHSFQTLPRPTIPIGINLGKNKDTPNEQASQDYTIGLQTLYPYGDYFVINISSPNTQGLRDLQEAKALEKLLTDILQTRDRCIQSHQVKKPIFLKIAPDLTEEQLIEIMEIVLHTKMDGMIATNTTLSREGLLNQVSSHETGGLSGRPLTSRSTRWIAEIYRFTQGKVPIIGVGGIFTAEDAYAKIRAGASLVQVYTGMIYQGPAVVKQINQGLVKLLKRDGFASVQDAVGVDVSI
ncbi:quinone-dependent dihydroorotate dehydrogenase [Thermoactinomyces sp. DSM 45892]|uniref:quinone-dependent dihydroorotate dehydrogenase n=1 Tax=Thermoactinomyces sp. DSM 45892 TaxID=1882753 RepID=UPI00089C91DA|nr:quinone-dependent dihydroorotate dehydrogenase [Thermoactinomyces sp. DSM 45892]SDZ34016.1 dihydroorotate oxidase A [Thermoactinomyces sp. DSM 45892]